MSKKEYPAKLTTGYYRVREVWEDEASQLGAYRLLANAKAKCDENPGSRVFDNDGNVIYPEEAVPVTGAEESEEQPVLDEPEEKEVEEQPKEDVPADKEEHTEEKKEATVDEDEFPTAEELPATIAYGKLKTLMNIRKKPSLDVEVIQFCDGWLKIKCAEAEDGVAYVLNSADTYAFTASKIYTVAPGDNLWQIAEKELRDGNRCADIRTLNGLTSNAIRVGMKLLIP